MLPVLFTLTIPPSLGIVVWLALSAASGAWQVRSGRAAGEKELWKTFGTWTAGTAAVLYLAVRVLGGQNILHLERPLAIPVHTYGILVAAGFLVAMTLAARAADRSGLNRDKVLDLSFGILVAAMIGSRILFIIVNWDEYAHDLAGIFQFWKGGLVFYGGFIGAVLFSIWYMRRHDMQFLPYADAMGPTVAIGQALGRIGCFSAGCCWGDACDTHYLFAARFPPDSLAYQSQAAAQAIPPGAPSTIAIHPTQLYEALGCALIFVFLTANFYAMLAGRVTGIDVTSESFRNQVSPLNTPLDPHLVAAVRDASTSSFHLAMILGAGLLLAGAIVNWVGIQNNVAQSQQEEASEKEPAPAASA